MRIATRAAARRLFRAGHRSRRERLLEFTNVSIQMLNNIWINVRAAENSPQMRRRDVPFVEKCLARSKRQPGLKLMLPELPKDGVGREIGATFTVSLLKAA